MSDKTNNIFTPEDILQQAQANFNAICLVVTAYLKEQGLSADEFWAFVGDQYAQGWQQITTAKEVAYQAALNMASLGCKLNALTGDEKLAQAVLSVWPAEESLSYFGVTQEDAAHIWNVFKAITEPSGYTYTWYREGDKVTMTFSR